MQANTPQTTIEDATLLTEPALDLFLDLLRVIADHEEAEGQTAGRTPQGARRLPVPLIAPPLDGGSSV